MYKYKKHWVTGYVMLPCFTVKALEGADNVELTCSDFLSKIFELFFAPHWSGKVYFTGEYEE